MSSVNKVTLIGNLTRDPEARSFQNGGRVVNFSLATNERWTDKATGEKKDRSQFHNVVTFNEGIAGVAERYLKKGSKAYIEGQIETRKYTDKDGHERYVTEIVLRPYRGELILLDNKNDDGGQDTAPARPAQGGSARSAKPAQHFDELEDEIPFDTIRTMA